MRIACLGWGSLIWKPENLLIQRAWFTDGPILPIEFTRQSRDGRLTLVITATASPVRTLWALMATEDLNTAKESLRIREGIGEQKANTGIGTITSHNVPANENAVAQIIRNWMNSLALDAVIWTNLPPKFNGQEDTIPSLPDAITYLEGLDINKRQHAEEYIRKAPFQIDTAYRRAFEIKWGWSRSSLF